MLRRLFILSLILNLLLSSACSSRTNNSISQTNNGGIPMKIIVNIGNQNFISTLEDNESAKTFVDNLPLTINMKDLNDNEKYYDLPFNMKKDSSYNPEKIKAGDIMLYSSNCLVLFYKTFQTSYSYIPIGRVNNIDKYLEALGKKDVNVTFRLEDSEISLKK